MSRTVVVMTLLSMLMVNEAEADAASDLNLAEKFSPVLILTEETSTNYDATVPIRVIKPEPVGIVFAQYADSLRFSYYEQHPETNPPYEGTVVGFEGWNPPLTFPNVKKIPPSSIPPTSVPGNIFLTTQQKSAFEYIGTPPRARYGLYQVIPHFDYPGATAREWNDTYTGSGSYAGEPSSDDSLSAQTEAGRRIAKKVIAGSFSSAIFSYVLVDVQESGANLGGQGNRIISVHVPTG